MALAGGVCVRAKNDRLTCVSPIFSFWKCKLLFIVILFRWKQRNSKNFSVLISLSYQNFCVKFHEVLNFGYLLPLVNCSCLSNIEAIGIRNFSKH